MQRVANVAQVDELVDLAIGVAGDVGQHGLARGLLGEPVHRHDGEQLVDGPAVGQRLEDREVAEVGVQSIMSKPFNSSGT